MTTLARVVGLAAAALVTIGPLSAAHAITIYPIDRAAILAGSRFDVKVELDSVVPETVVTIMINGAAPEATLGRPLQFIAKEPGVDGSAAILRDVSLGPGTYVVSATDGRASRSVAWTVYATAPRTAKNVILFIADGMSLAHRTAVRMLSKEITEGRYRGALAMDAMPRMALVGTAGVDSIITDSANSMSAYTTGHKSSVNALGVYADRTTPALEEVGAHVVYGIAGYKTHCKACLVVRQEADGMRRYCHLATGNYNVRTSGVYGDLGLFTADEEIGADVAEVFNMLTGYTRPRALTHLLVAPAFLRDGMAARIRREAEHAREGRPARIIAKMNSLADPRLIDELYRAGRAGVRVDLIVRGICCLRPGVPGLSDNIRVISIVDRNLEHARVFAFENGGEPEYLLASSDWMPRNLDHRVETAFPVRDRRLQRRVREILDTQLADTVKARVILPDGRSARVAVGGAAPVRSQERLYALAARG